MSEAISVQDTIQSLQNLAFENGFISSAIGIDFDGFTPSEMACDYRQDWQEHYFSNGMQFVDPVITSTPALNGPITWTELQKQNNFKNNKVLNEANDFNLKDGLIIPVKFRKKSIVSFSLDRKKNISFKEKEYLLYQVRLILGEYFSGKYINTDIPDLRADFWATLTLKSHGYGYKEIAEIQGINLETVKSRIKKICTSLGAKDVTHAVSLAKDLDLIA